MTSTLPLIHILSAYAAELNDVEERLQSAMQTVSGLRSQVLYEISMFSRPVDPGAPVDQGAPAPGKPPRPTEGGVAVTKDGCDPSKAGGDGSADAGAGANVVLGGVDITPEADQALDGAGLGEGVRNPDDPRPAPGSIADIVLDYYATFGARPCDISDILNYPIITVLNAIQDGRRRSDRRAARGDLIRYCQLPEHLQAAVSPDVTKPLMAASA